MIVWERAEIPGNFGPDKKRFVIVVSGRIVTGMSMIIHRTRRSRTGWIVGCALNLGWEMVYPVLHVIKNLLSDNLSEPWSLLRHHRMLWSKSWSSRHP